MKSQKLLQFGFFIVISLGWTAASAQSVCYYSWLGGSQSVGIDYDLTVQDAVCASVDNGSISVDPAYYGNRNPLQVNITYSWSNGATTQSVSDLTSGSYSVTITTTYRVPRLIGNPGVLTCVQVESTTVGVESSCCLRAEVATTNECGSTKGTATVTALYGTGPYTYEWSNGTTTSSTNSNTDQITGLSAGTYYVTVTDQNCSTVESFTVTNLANSPNLSITNIVDPTCFGGSDGSTIALTVQFQLALTGPHTYSWTGPNNYAATNNANSILGISQNQISNLFAGTYYVTVTDHLGCSASTSATLSEPTQILINPLVSSVSCLGDSDGGITVTPTGGTPSGGNYNYYWFDNSTDFGTSSSVSGLTAGMYSVTVEDNNGCVVSTTVPVEEPEELIAYGQFSVFGDYNISVRGGSNGWIRTHVTGGNGGYSYNWIGPGSPTGPNPTGLGAGAYFLQVTDSKGCEELAGPFNLREP